MTDNNKQNKGHTQKMPRKKLLLYVFNIAVPILLIGLFFFFWAMQEMLLGVIACLLLELVFLFGSIIAYHISIISAVMSKQNERAEKDRQLHEKEKNKN